MKKKSGKSSSAASQKKYELSNERSKGKAAEPVAIYARTPLKKARSKKRVIAGVAASEEVLQLATAKGLIPHLETAVMLIRKSFGKVKKLRLSVDIDPEIENEEWITISAEVQGSLNELVRCHGYYLDAVIQNVEMDKLAFIHFSPVVA